MLRRVEVSYVETTEEEAKLKKVAEILSEAVYAYLKCKESARKHSPLTGEEN